MHSETRRYSILIIFLLALRPLAVNAAGPIVESPNEKIGGIRALCQWEPDYEYLIATMHMENNFEDNILEVYDASFEPQKRIGKFELDAFPYSIVPFSDKLIVVCQTATAYLVYAFTYTADSIKMIFKDGSKYPPELIYFGPSNHAAVAVPVLDWVNGDRIPVSANVYLLQGKSTVKPLNLPWNRRFGLEK